MTSRVSLRTRLALLYAGLALLVLAISLLSVYEVAHRDALGRVDSSLRSDARKLGGLAEGAEHGSENDSGERFVNARDAVASGHLLALYDDHRVIAPTPRREPRAQRPGIGSFRRAGARRHDRPSVRELQGQRRSDRQRRIRHGCRTAATGDGIDGGAAARDAARRGGGRGADLDRSVVAARRGLRPLESINMLRTRWLPMRSACDRARETGTRSVRWRP